jgi:plasmid stabilization system protein ParE
MVDIIWTQTAIEDLKAIGEYIGKGSEYYSKIVVQKIYHTVGRLRDFPLSGRKIPEFDNENLREVLSQNYRIFYYFESNQVSILTIVHNKQSV